MARIIAPPKNRLIDMNDFEAGSSADGSPVALGANGNFRPVPRPALTFAASRWFSLGYPSRFTQNSSGFLLNEPLATPWYCHTPTPIDRLSAWVVTAGESSSVIRLGLCADNNGMPGALLIDGGTISTSSTGGKNVSVTYTIPRGWVWAWQVLQDCPTTPPVLMAWQRCMLDLGAVNENDTSAINCVYTTTPVSGAFPSSFPSPTLAYKMMPRIQARPA